MHKPEEIASKFLGVPFEALDDRAKKVARHIAERKHIARDLQKEIEARTTLGQRAADAVASFGGSWTFVALFAATMLVWVGLNAYLLMSRARTFDPYPYILLNLFLSMLAAIQAPIILMSQNRHSERDRINADHDYEVNLKAELEIMLLHEKIDLLREGQWEDLLALQKQQIQLLTDLAGSNAAARVRPVVTFRPRDPGRAARSWSGPGPSNRPLPAVAGAAAGSGNTGCDPGVDHIPSAGGLVMPAP